MKLPEQGKQVPVDTWEQAEHIAMAAAINGGTNVTTFRALIIERGIGGGEVIAVVVVEEEP